MTFTHVSGSVAYTQEQYKGSMHMLYEGGLLAVVVVFFFLRDWRATLIAAAALPLSILPAFTAMSWLGYSLNVITLLALAVVVGILVDDAIVEIENIERHSRKGMPVAQAVSEGVAEIALAVTATTMSLVVVFLPITLMSGVPGLFFKQFGWTALIAVLASFLVARLLTPLMAARWLRANQERHEGVGRLMHWYMSTVRWCLGHRKTTMAAAVVFFLASIALAALLPSGLIPPSDGGYTTVNIELPPGSPLESTLRVAEYARASVKDVPGIASVLTTVGDAQLSGGGPEGDTQRAGESRKGALIVTLAPRDARVRQVVVENMLREKLLAVPGARFHVGAGRPGEKMELILASDNAKALKASAQELQHQLLGVPGLSNISTTASLERPEIIIRPDFQRAAERGITTAAIGEVARIATSGDFDAQAAKLNLDGRQIYLRVRVADAARQDLDTLAKMRIRGRDGPVPLSSVADLSIESGPSQIDRYDRHRYVTVGADLGGTPLGAALKAALDLPAARGLPSSVRLIQSGDAEAAAELASAFGIATVVPITILSVLPLSFGGAFVALLLAHSELDLPAMIGVVMLIGIVSKNSILLVEYTVVGIRDRGLVRDEAILEACRNRARAIIMTTFAMTAGMLPIALGYGADSSFRQPMALAAIGGLLSSTALSLLVVPVVFTYVDGFERRLRRIWRREPRDAAISIVLNQ